MNLAQRFVLFLLKTLKSTFAHKSSLIALLNGLILESERLSLQNNL